MEQPPVTKTPTSTKIPPQPSDDAKSEAVEPKGRPAEGAEQATAGAPQPPPPAMAADPKDEAAEIAEAQAASFNALVDIPEEELARIEDGMVWAEETTDRGLVITVTKSTSGPAVTREAVLALGATPDAVAAAKARLLKQFVDA
jgi:hypothetical protein